MRYKAVIIHICGAKSFSCKGQILALWLLASACTPIVDNRGHTLQSMDMAQIIKGQSQREDVEAVLGSPSVKSNYGKETWYYITAQKETVGVFAPELTKQRVSQITFDKDGTVDDIVRYEQEKGKKVVLVEKTTPSAGHSLTFLEQLLGNFGKFATPGRQIDPSGGR